MSNDRSDEKLRAAFEWWAKGSWDHRYSVDRMTHNQEFYRDHRTQYAWEGWKAHAALAKSEVEQR